MPGLAATERLTHCDLCGSTNLRDRDVGYEIQECSKCGYRFANPRPSQADIAEAYSDANYYDQWIEDDTGRQQMWHKRWRHIQPFLSGSHPWMSELAWALS
jgi:transcription elongation factor Elf1